MPHTPLAVPFPRGFHYRHTVFSHGWCSLAPFTVTLEPLSLSRITRCPSGAVAVIRSTGDADAPAVTVSSRRTLGARDQRHCTEAASAVFNIALDLAPFHAAVRKDPHAGWMAVRRTGRHLRGETFFEDAVKMILTTNCTWSLTETMNTNLVRTLGEGPDPDTHAFPAPEAIADCSEEFLRQEVRLGYRAPFVLALAQRVAREGYAIENFRTDSAPSDDIYRELRGIKGVGDYAASNLLKLLGRFDRLGLDSWCRMKFAELHNGGAAATDAEIDRFYDRFGEWRGLVMWLDVTRDWYFEKFPF